MSSFTALKDTSQGCDNLVRNELNTANLAFLPLAIVSQIAEQREMAQENDDHMAVLLNETSLVDGQYIFHNPDGSIRMKAKRDHIRVSTMKYIPQLGSLVVGFNFGAFQIWNLRTLDLEFTSQVNVECLPVTHFGFQVRALFRLLDPTCYTVYDPTNIFHTQPEERCSLTQYLKGNNSALFLFYPRIV